MDNPQPGQDQCADPPPFWCDICRVACASANNLQSHFMGARHRRAEEALKTNQDAPKTDQEGEEALKSNQAGEEAPKTDQEGLKTNQVEGGEPKPGESLVDQIDACTDAEPALGLEYIYEFQNDGGYSRYECRLCECFLGRNHMFMHIVGARHRIQYLSRHHQSLGITNASIMKGPKKLKRLRQLCVKVEMEYGRKQINVVKGQSTIPSFCNGPAPLPCINYGTDSKKMIDFTNDEFTDVEEKPKEELAVDEDYVVTFLELKTLQGASTMKGGVGQESLLQLAAEEKEKAKEHKDVEKENDEGTDSDLEGNTDQHEVPTKEELFEFLDSFQVFELRDVHFLMRVSGKLRKVLARHEKRCQKEGRGKMAFDTQDAHPSLPSFTNQHGLMLPAEFPGSVSYPTEALEEMHTESISASNQAEVLTANQLHKTSPISKKLSASLGTGSNKKLSFRIAGPPAEKNPQTSSELLTNMQREFAAKSNSQKLAIAETDLDDRNLAIDPPPPSLKPLFESTRDVQDSRLLSSALNNRGTSIPEPRPLIDHKDRASVTSVRGPFPNEHLQGSTAFASSRSSYPLGPSGNSAGSVTSRVSNEHLQGSTFAPSRSSYPPGPAGNSAGSVTSRVSNEHLQGSTSFAPSRSSYPHEPSGNSAVTSRVSNEHEHFKNVAYYSSPVTPNTQGQMRNPALPYPPSSSNEPMRNSATFAFPRAPGSHEMLRNAAASGYLRPPQSYRQQENPAHPRAPFPHPPNSAPRASPPPLHVAKDDVTARFFESLKDMEVSEVVSTLNKITATNPAFQGIHVPSLVKYLMDTGKLKSSNRK